MATAVQTPPAPTSSGTSSNLLFPSLVATAVLVAGFVVAFFLVPNFWQESLAPSLSSLGLFSETALRWLTQFLVVLATIFLVNKVSGTHPPLGIRGGIFLIMTFLLTTFFLTRAFWVGFADTSWQVYASAGLAGLLLFLSFRLLSSERGRGWMISLEEQGWFHLTSFKASQGLRLRRYTMIGFLLVGLSGAYSIFSHELFGKDPLLLEIPFLDRSVEITSNPNLILPLLFSLATLWLSWRAVNIPAFADFLIATEAEMNKVSWTSRKRLYKDTVVVLVTVILMAAFLFIVDMFWGWLLSREAISVLPPKSEERREISPQGDGLGW